MMRKDVNKPKGKTSAYAFFVQTCREEHRKKNPEQSVNFAEFSKKCSERWKVRQTDRSVTCLTVQCVSVVQVCVSRVLQQVSPSEVRHLVMRHICDDDKTTDKP